ncbi:MAG TPA: FeoA family protein [Candidatus Hodarchaeales archaeon]|nr:FeoA family protein [Candidatus Hodarchaeales archaeon]
MNLPFALGRKRMVQANDSRTPVSNLTPQGSIHNSREFFLLRDALPGTYLEINTILAEQRRSSRLSELGLLPGERIRVVQSVGGYVVIDIRSARYGVSASVSDKIVVSPWPREKEND